MTIQIPKGILVMFGLSAFGFASALAAPGVGLVIALLGVCIGIYLAEDVNKSILAKSGYEIVEGKLVKKGKK